MKNIKSLSAVAILSAAAVFLTPVVHAGSSQAVTHDVVKQTPSSKGDARDSNVSTAKKAASGTKVSSSNSAGKKEIKTQNTDAQKKSRRTEAQRIITVHVKGLTCPFCVLGLEKRLKAISSVATISSIWGKGEVYVKLTAGQSVSDDDL